MATKKTKADLRMRADSAMLLDWLRGAKVL